MLTVAAGGLQGWAQLKLLPGHGFLASWQPTYVREGPKRYHLERTSFKSLKVMQYLSPAPILLVQSES